MLADVTRDGGFPPVLLQPIDFVALWQARRAQAQAPQPAATACNRLAGTGSVHGGRLARHPRLRIRREG